MGTKVTLIWLATALTLMAFSILPAFQNEFWSSTTPHIRWTIFASQILLLAAGIVQGLAARYR